MGLVALYRKWRAHRKQKWDAYVLATYYHREYQKWYRLNYWRFTPVEGWQLGYNCNDIPFMALLYIHIHGVEPTRPTYSQIAAETNVPERYIRSFV